MPLAPEVSALAREVDPRCHGPRWKCTRSHRALMQVGGGWAWVIHSRVSYPQSSRRRPRLSVPPGIVDPMTFRPALLQLTVLLVITLTCSTGAVLATTSGRLKDASAAQPCLPTDQPPGLAPPGSPLPMSSGPRPSGSLPSHRAGTPAAPSPDGTLHHPLPGAGLPSCRSPGQASGLPPPDPPLSRPTSFGWPLAPLHPVVRPFRAPSTPYGPGHRGVDLGSQPGAPVLAAGDGVVAFAGQVVGRGVVSVDHANGIRTTYEPVAVLVSAGQRVGRGTVVGLLAAGHDGCVDAAACLHWGARRGAEYLDPLGLLSSGRVRLLPWDGGDV
jgi:murein DD-endopeptidase MepM/ murein hydrolase activator NlpD